MGQQRSTCTAPPREHAQNRERVAVRGLDVAAQVEFESAYLWETMISHIFLQPRYPISGSRVETRKAQAFTLRVNTEFSACIEPRLELGARVASHSAAVQVAFESASFETRISHLRFKG
jgi:hypothetical protein